MVTPKESTSQYPYLLIYRKEHVLPINIEINALPTTSFAKEEYHSSPLQYRLLQLMQLEEQTEKEVTTIQKRQEASKKHFDKKNISKEFVKDQYDFVEQI